MNYRSALVLAAFCAASCGEQTPTRNLAAEEAEAARQAAAEAKAALLAPTVPGVSIPGEFHGRFAETAGDCNNSSPTTTAIEIGAGGWIGWEEGARVTEPMRPFGDSPRWRVTNRAGASEYPGTLALHRMPRGVEFEEVVEGRTIRTRFVRCV